MLRADTRPSEVPSTKPSSFEPSRRMRPVRRVERHDARRLVLVNGRACEVAIGRAVVRNLKPGELAVLQLPHTAAAQQVAGDMPGAVVEIAGIARADQILAIDLAAVEPELSQLLEVVC